MIHEHGDIVMVEVDEDAFDFEFNEGNKRIVMYLTQTTIEHVTIPPGSYTIVGLSSKLSEDEWRGIVEYNMGGFVDYDIPEHLKERIIGRLPTATESGLSLLKSKNLSPDTTLILKKNKL